MAFVAALPLRHTLRHTPLPKFRPLRFYSCTSSNLRGFDLLRSDLSRLSALFRTDYSSILNPSLALHRYDHNAIARYYDSRPITALVRVTSVAVPFLFWLFRVKLYDKWMADDQPKITTLRAQQLRTLLTNAGPTYLKIGQALGNRPDIIGLIYSNELQQLVDDVGTFDSAIAEAIIIHQLSIESLTDVFSDFDMHPVASASLGQVHKATLNTGEQVAVKVQRPTVERDAALDVYVLRKVAKIAKKRFKLRSDLVGIVDEFATRLWEELDYINEAANCERFQRLYAEYNRNVVVPLIFSQYTTKRVLCMEWMDGDKAPWFPKDDAQRLIGIGVQCSLTQLLDDGFVHADPHRGNLLRTKDGKLCYLDFGMCVQVDQHIRDDLIVAIVRLINRDYENLAVDFVKLGFLPPDADTKPLVPLLIKAFGDASTGSSLSDLSFSKLANNLSGLAYATPIRIPVFFSLIIRSLTILEGFALQTDAAFKIVDESYPYVVRRILTDDSPAFRRALEGVLIDTETGRVRWNRLDSLLKTRSSSVPYDTTGSAPSTAKGALTGVSSQTLNRVIDFALSKRGAFLRKALLLELTDTADAFQLAIGKSISDASRGLLPAPSEQADMERVEKAISLAQDLRVRAPDLFASKPNSQLESREQQEQRQVLLRQGLADASKTVVGSLLERNARRLIRRAIEKVFGEKTDSSSIDT